MTEKRAQTEVIMIHETTRDSVIRDTYSLASLVAVIGLGVVVDSAALQWIAGILWLLVFLSTMASIKMSHRMTISQARARLDELERRTPSTKESGT